MIEHNFNFVAIVIVFCSLVQSLFGIGLLVFGTPLLLLAKFSFTDAIAIVLPCSLSVSLAQISISRSKLDKESWLVVAWTVPFVVLSISFLLTYGGSFKIRSVVGVMLVLSSLIREWPTLQAKLQRLLKSQSKLYLAITGLIHGFTNMGGALLSLYCATVFKDKNQIRNSIAFAYSVMAACQLAVALYIGSISFSFYHIVYVILATATYLVVGESLFRRLGAASYKTILTAFMGLLGVVLLLT